MFNIVFVLKYIVFVPNWTLSVLNITNKFNEELELY